MNRIDLLGLPFDDLNASEVVDAMLARPPGAPFAYVVTPNADHLARLKRVPRLRLVYDAAWLRVLDSQLLKHAARGLGVPAPRVATGADITAVLLAALPPQRIAIIGLDAKHLPALAAAHPAHHFIHHAPPRELLTNQLAFRRARDFALRTDAAFTFIALGSPLQELLAYAIARQPGSRGIGLCIGAALEFRAGAAPRAPAWMRHLGLEWLHRLARDPRRLAGRYLLDDPPILFDLLAARFSRTTPRSPPDQHPPAAPAAILAPDPYPPPPRAHLHEIQDAR